MSRYRVVAVLVAAAVTVLLPHLSAAEQASPQQRTGKIYFVPLGEFSSLRMDDLVAYYKQRFGLKIEMLPAVRFENAVVDYGRQQLIAEELIALMKRQYPKIANDPQAFLIGITAVDMYIRQHTWRFAFSRREEGRFAVVSSARMDPITFGEMPDAELLHRRVRKMISKNIGIMYYQLPQSANRNSVLYGPILDLDDLDTIGEDF